MTHHLHLEFNTTKELLEFAAKHLLPTHTVMPSLSSDTPFVLTGANDIAQLKDDNAKAAKEGDSKGTKEPKKTKVKVEDPQPTSENVDEVEGARATAETEAAEESKTKAVKKAAEKAAPAAEEETDGELDYKRDVRPTAILLIKTAGGQETMREIFDDFGVTNAAELTPAQLPAYLKAVQAALAEAKLAEQE